MDQDEANNSKSIPAIPAGGVYRVCTLPYCSNYTPPGANLDQPETELTHPARVLPADCNEQCKAVDDAEKGKITDRRNQDEVMETMYQKTIDRGVSFLSFISRGSMSPGNCSKNSSGIFCRICHDGEGFERLISPCQCSGSVALVHRSCIEKWLSTANHDTCELCHFKYSISRHPRPFLNWLCEPAVQDDQRNLVGDIICFFLLTPLAGISTYLCATGAAFYLEEKKSESIGLICLCIILVLIYIAWVLLTIKYHVQVWFVWRDSNQEIRLVETGRQPVSRTEWRNPYQDINYETVAEESTLSSPDSPTNANQVDMIKCEIFPPPPPPCPPVTPCVSRSDLCPSTARLDMTTSSFYLAAEKEQDLLTKEAYGLNRHAVDNRMLFPTFKPRSTLGTSTSTPILYPPSPAPLKSLGVIRSVVSTANLTPRHSFGSYTRLADCSERAKGDRPFSSVFSLSKSRSMDDLSCSQAENRCLTSSVENDRNIDVVGRKMTVNSATQTPASASFHFEYQNCSIAASAVPVNLCLEESLRKIEGGSQSDSFPLTHINSILLSDDLSQQPCCDPRQESAVLPPPSPQVLPLSPLVMSVETIDTVNKGLLRNDGVIYAECLAKPMDEPSPYSPSVYCFRPVQVASWRSLQDAALAQKEGDHSVSLRTFTFDQQSGKDVESSATTEQVKTSAPLQRESKAQNVGEDDTEEEDYKIDFDKRIAAFESIISSQSQDVVQRRPGMFSPSSSGSKPIRLPGMVSDSPSQR